MSEPSTVLRLASATDEDFSRLSRIVWDHLAVMPPPQQRRRRQSAEDDSDEDARPQPDSPPNRDADGDEEMGGVTGGETQQLVKKMVRYVLSCEYSRTPIRRNGIKEKVSGPHGREFKKVFNEAQKQLRGIFGMEMVELPVRDRNLMTTDQKRKAVKSQSQKEATSNAYVLQSVLPDKYRTSTILQPSKVQSADGEASYMALYTMIISIITLSGGELSDPRLRRHLTRLNAAENMPSGNPGDPNAPSEKTEAVLQRMIKHGYLVKNTETGAQGDGEEATTWYVGPRGKVEVNNKAIASFVRTVYGETNDELEKKLQVSLKERATLSAVEEVIEPQATQVNGNWSDNGDPGPSFRRRSIRRGVQQQQEDDDDDE